MINYDMPWNPTRLEQRLGRIHRIGQDRDVYAFNFVATESEEGQPIVEGRILHRLLEKLDQMNEALEGRVFDVIGEVLSLNDVTSRTCSGMRPMTPGGSMSTSIRSTASIRPSSKNTRKPRELRLRAATWIFRHSIAGTSRSKSVG